MNKFSFVCLIFLISVLSNVYAGGVDLLYYYGSRYISLGGNQVSISKDAYAPFYNPAAMTGVEKGAIAINSSTLMSQNGAPIGADDNQTKTSWMLNSLFYVGGVYSVNDRVSFGFGIFPTALQGAKFKHVDYGSGGAAPISDREYSNLLARIEFAPSVAVRVYENLSVGLSYRIGYTRYDKQAGNFASIVGPAAAFIDESVTGWDASGLKAGIFLNDWNGLSAGLTYRLETQLDLAGSTAVTFGNGQTVSFETTQSPRIPAQLQAGTSYEYRPGISWLPSEMLTAFTYEFTRNSVLSDVAVLKGFGATVDAALGFPQGTTSDVVDGGLKKKDSHAFHLGQEGTFHLSEKNKFRVGLGFVFETSDGYSDWPNALLSPAVYGLGYGVGGQYECGSHTIGLAANYDYYSKRSTNIDPSLAANTFKGKYDLTIYYAILDYQYRF